MGDRISVRMFGAVGDGIIDDTAAIQSAVDWLQSTKGGQLFFPAGRYRTSATITVTGYGITLCGAGTGGGREATQIYWPGNTDPIIKVDASGGDIDNFHVSDIQLAGNGAGGGAGLAMYSGTHAIYNCSIRNLTVVQAGGNGLDVNGSAYGGGAGIFDLHIPRLVVIGCGGDGVRTNGAQQITAGHLYLNSNGGHGWEATATGSVSAEMLVLGGIGGGKWALHLTTCESWSIHQVYTESSATGQIYLDQQRGLSIDDASQVRQTGTSYGLLINNATQYTANVLIRLAWSNLSTAHKAITFTSGQTNYAIHLFDRPGNVMMPADVDYGVTGDTFPPHQVMFHSLDLNLSMPGLVTVGTAAAGDVQTKIDPVVADPHNAGTFDATSGGLFDGVAGNSVYYLEIDSTGGTDTFSWYRQTADFQGSKTSGVAMTGAAQTLDNGVTVTWGTTTGHTLGDHGSFGAAISHSLRVDGGFQFGYGSRPTQGRVHDFFGGRRAQINVGNGADYANGRGAGYGFLPGTAVDESAPVGQILAEAVGANQNEYNLSFETYDTTPAVGAVVPNGGNVGLFDVTSGGVYNGISFDSLFAVEVDGLAGIAAVAAAPTAGGSGYAIGDVLTLTTGGGAGLVQVATVDGSGAVLTLFLRDPGAGYSTGAGQATSGGGGHGCTVDVTAIADTFKWRNNGAAYSNRNTMTGSAQLLALGVTVTWATTSGHTAGDKGTITALAGALTEKMNLSKDGMKMLPGYGIGTATNPTGTVWSSEIRASKITHANTNNMAVGWYWWADTVGSDLKLFDDLSGLFATFSRTGLLWAQPARFAQTITVVQELYVNNSAAALYAGNGSPEGVVFAAQGSLFLRLDAGGVPNVTLYAKESGGATEFGWNPLGKPALPPATPKLLEGDNAGGIQAVPTGSAIADPSGGSTVDAEARTAVASVLALLRTLGLIAP